jgi:hypothetical protein
MKRKHNTDVEVPIICVSSDSDIEDEQDEKKDNSISKRTKNRQALPSLLSKIDLSQFKYKDESKSKRNIVEWDEEPGHRTNCTSFKFNDVRVKIGDTIYMNNDHVFDEKRECYWIMYIENFIEHKIRNGQYQMFIIGRWFWREKDISKRIRPQNDINTETKDNCEIVKFFSQSLIVIIVP